MIQIDFQKFKTSCIEFLYDLHITQSILLFLGKIRVCFISFDMIINSRFTLTHQTIIKSREKGCIIGQRFMDLKPGNTDTHHNISHRMGFREHIFDLFAGPEIPVRHIMFFHDFLIIRCQALPFTDTFHDLERLFGFNPFVDQIDHNIISCTDGCGNLGFSLLDQRLCIAQPYIRTMGQT